MLVDKEPNSKSPVLGYSMPTPGPRHTHKGTKHPGYKPTCEHCGVSAHISERTILKRLEDGLKSQGMQVMSSSSGPQGTPIGMITPLIKLLREKGFQVTV